MRPVFGVSFMYALKFTIPWVCYRRRNLWLRLALALSCPPLILLERVGLVAVTVFGGSFTIGASFTITVVGVGSDIDSDNGTDDGPHTAASYPPQNSIPYHTMPYHTYLVVAGAVRVGVPKPCVRLNTHTHTHTQGRTHTGTHTYMGTHIRHTHAWYTCVDQFHGHTHSAQSVYR